MNQQPHEKTHTPQEYFAYVGSLESQEAIAALAKQMLSDRQYGLWAVALDAPERQLLKAFEAKLSHYQAVSRADWAALKEDCLLLFDSSIASTVDHLISALRTPAIAESAIRSASLALLRANELKAHQQAQTFMRDLLKRAIKSSSAASDN
ncbi:MAG: hypothetical protein F6J87_24295 [Spirulina sp. SIO3F2]|nr:hypothetical protein [Spirulina sp. SIO3F2]